VPASLLRWTITRYRPRCRTGRRPAHSRATAPGETRKTPAGIRWRHCALKRRHLAAVQATVVCTVMTMPVRGALMLPCRIREVSLVLWAVPAGQCKESKACDDAGALGCSLPFRRTSTRRICAFSHVLAMHIERVGTEQHGLSFTYFKRSL
jgi:hypothetical protein